MRTKRQPLDASTKLYIELEELLDRHRRAGAPEEQIKAIIERLWRGSIALIEAGSFWGGEHRR